MESKFWGQLNKAASFLKHADLDPNGVLTPFSYEANDTVLVIACTYYELLGNRSTTEMRVLMLWYMSLHPDSLSNDLDPAMVALLGSNSDVQFLPRSEQLAIGLTLLRKALAQP